MVLKYAALVIQLNDVSAEVLESILLSCIFWDRADVEGPREGTDGGVCASGSVIGLFAFTRVPHYFPVAKVNITISFMRGSFYCTPFMQIYNITLIARRVYISHFTVTS